MSNEQEAFEADAEPYGFDLTRRECAAPEPWSEYADDATGHRWAGWSAALAWAATQQAPVAWSLSFHGDDINATTTFSSEAAAVRYADGCATPDVCNRNPDRPKVIPLYAHPAPAECAVPEWRPIETAPKDGTSILGWRRGVIASACCVPRDDCEMWVFGVHGGSVEDWPEVKPTHWMPLPAAPKPQGGA